MAITSAFFTANDKQCIDYKFIHLGTVLATNHSCILDSHTIAQWGPMWPCVSNVSDIWRSQVCALPWELMISQLQIKQSLTYFDVMQTYNSVKDILKIKIQFGVYVVSNAAVLLCRHTTLLTLSVAWRHNSYVRPPPPKNYLQLLQFVVVSFTVFVAVFRVVTQRSSPCFLNWGGALRDDPEIP